jgi:hypothetical protein
MENVCKVINIINTYVFITHCTNKAEKGRERERKRKRILQEQTQLDVEHEETEKNRLPK